MVLAYFLFFTWRSLGLYFDQDDMMNLYRAWSMPIRDLFKANLFFWSDSFRPLGALFYRSVFAIAGFNPVPFRIICLSLGIVNIGLCYWVTKLISSSGRVAALTILLFAFQSRLMEVWFRTAVVYDLLCFTFFYLALGLYIQARRRAGNPSLPRSSAVVICYICALNSKEVAVGLPAILVAYELLFDCGTLIRFSLPAFLALLNIPYIIGKTTGAGAMTNNPAYQSEYTLDRFAHTSALYLNYIFVRPDDITAAVAVSIMGLMLLMALVLRSRNLVFGWILLVVGALPVSFLSYRGGFVLYIAYVGWCIYAGQFLVILQDLMPVNRTALAGIVFVAVGWRAGKTNLHDQRSDRRSWLYDPPRLVRTMADDLRRQQLRLPRGARLLLLDDAFGSDGWTSWFLVKLLYRDDTLVVDRQRMMDPKPSSWDGYQYVFNYQRGHYLQLKP